MTETGWRETIIVETYVYDPLEAFRQAAAASKVRRLGLDPEFMPGRWDVHLIGVAQVLHPEGRGPDPFIWTFEARE